MEQQKVRETKGALLLMLTSLIWGVAFVFQKTGMEHIGPFAFNFFRCVVCVMFLSFVNMYFSAKNRRDKSEKSVIQADEEYIWYKDKPLIFGGILIGVALFLGMSTQQIGMVTTSASKAGFITTMYIVIVPIMGIFYGRKTNIKMWISVFIAAVGLYLLSIKAGFVIEKGDFFLFLSAMSFALQIVFVDLFAPKADAIKLSLIQFSTTLVLSFIAMIILEPISMKAVLDASVAILYTGLLSSGVGFTMQIVAQKNLPPTIASLIMSTESVISVIAGAILLGETLSSRELIGCVFIAVAVVLAQINIPIGKKSKIKSEAI